jgi:hypothetical protein
MRTTVLPIQLQQDKKRHYRHMKNIKTAFFLTLLSITLNACGQSIEKRTILGKSYAEQELKSALTDKSQHTIIENKTEPIKDSLTAINIVELILFRTYGKKNIVQQRPYEIYLIDNYWVIIGTLPVDTEGGTFLIIMDSRDGRVIHLTHGK